MIKGTFKERAIKLCKNRMKNVKCGDVGQAKKVLDSIKNLTDRNKIFDIMVKYHNDSFGKNIKHNNFLSRYFDKDEIKEGKRKLRGV